MFNTGLETGMQSVHDVLNGESYSCLYYWQELLMTLHRKVVEKSL